jgi:hypothetical protein
MELPASRRRADKTHTAQCLSSQPHHSREQGKEWACAFSNQDEIWELKQA